MDRIARFLAPPLALAAMIGPAAARAPIAVTGAWGRATAPRAQVGAGYATIRNIGRAADRLIAASSPRARRVELHTMTMAGGVMRMRPLPNGLMIAPGAAAQLAPGGDHLMLIGLASPLVAGERVPVTLRFQRAGPITITLHVAPAGASGSQHPADR